MTQQKIASVFPTPNELNENYLGRNLIGAGPFNVSDRPDDEVEPEVSNYIRSVSPSV